MIFAIGQAVGNPSIKVKTWPCWVFRLMAPFSETMRELYAVRPLWQIPIELDNKRLVAFLGEKPHTPINEAMRATLTGLGCGSVTNRRPITQPVVS